MSATGERPFELLRRIQQAAVAAEHALPEQQQIEPRWGGLAFGVDDLRLVTPLTNVTDVVDCRGLTPVPRTQPWLRGITNVRGGLYSVVDLGLFLGRSQPAVVSVGKMLVLNVADLGCALMVTKVFGMRQFREEQARDDAADVDAALRPYVQRVFVQDGEVWGVFDINRLVASPAFRSVMVDASADAGTT